MPGTNNLNPVRAMIKLFASHGENRTAREMRVTVEAIHQMALVLRASWLALPVLALLVVIGMWWLMDRTLLLLQQGTTASFIMAGSLIFLLATLNNILRAAHHLSHEAITLRFENNDLIECLREQRQVADDANRAKSKFLAAHVFWKMNYSNIINMLHKNTTRSPTGLPARRHAIREILPMFGRLNCIIRIRDQHAS